MKKNTHWTRGLLWLMAFSLAAGLMGCTLEEEGEEKQPAVSVTEEEKSSSTEKSLEKEETKTDEQEEKEAPEDKEEEDPLLEKDTTQTPPVPALADDTKTASAIKTENTSPAELQQSPDPAPTETPPQEPAPTPLHTPSAPAPQNQGNTNLVWIPASGTKYHSNSGCSNMKNPTQVTQDEAVAMGYDACKRCH